MQDLVSLERELNAKASGQAPEAAAAESAPGKPTKKKKKKDGGKDILWTAHLDAFLRKAGGIFLSIFRGLYSPDRPTRRMSLFFLLSCAGIIVVIVLATQRYRVYKLAQKGALSGVEQTSKQIGEFLKRQADDARYRASMFAVGTFIAELKPVPGKRLPPGAMNLGQLDVVLECDSKETRELIETQLPKVKNQISTALIGLDREEVMTKDGKKKLRKSIVDHVNSWLPQGKVNDAHITRFLIN